VNILSVMPQTTATRDRRFFSTGWRRGANGATALSTKNLGMAVLFRLSDPFSFLLLLGAVSVWRACLWRIETNVCLKIASF
jgi:hypothetical protein